MTICVADYTSNRYKYEKTLHLYGRSFHKIDEFAELLQAHGIKEIGIQ
jgi:hypothetical protein